MNHKKILLIDDEIQEYIKRISELTREKNRIEKITRHDERVKNATHEEDSVYEKVKSERATLREAQKKIHKEETLKQNVRHEKAIQLKLDNALIKKQENKLLRETLIAEKSKYSNERERRKEEYKEQARRERQQRENPTVLPEGIIRERKQTRMPGVVLQEDEIHNAMENFDPAYDRMDEQGSNHDPDEDMNITSDLSSDDSEESAEIHESGPESAEHSYEHSSDEDEDEDEEIVAEQVLAQVVPGGPELEEDEDEDEPLQMKLDRKKAAASKASVVSSCFYCGQTC